MLASRRAIRAAELLMAGNKVQETDLAFCYGGGSPWGEKYIVKHYKRDCRESWHYEEDRTLYFKTYLRYAVTYSMMTFRIYKGLLGTHQSEPPTIDTDT